jgi:hypothetical protein
LYLFIIFLILVKTFIFAFYYPAFAIKRFSIKLGVIK